MNTYNSITKRIGVYIILCIVSFQTVNAQSLESNMRSFFSYHDNQAYKLVGFLAHPSNSFRYGYCEVSGDNIYITVTSKNNYTKMRIHKNGKRFDNLEVLDENDFFPAFSVSNFGKDILLDFWRSFDTSTLRFIENYFGNLNHLSCEQMCLAALTGLLWEYPYSASSSSSSSYSSSSSQASSSSSQSSSSYSSSSSSRSSSSSNSNASNRDRDFYYENVLSRRKLTENDLYGKTKDELSIMRNRIYAHYGYRFRRDDLFNYFKIYSWYNPYTSDPAPLWNRFSDIEQYNIEFIKRHER